MTTRVAAEALGVTPRRVGGYVSEGLLEARIEGGGAKRRYSISIASVEALRAERRGSEGEPPEHEGDGTEDAATPEQDAAALARGLAAELSDACYLLGRAEARVELALGAERTLGEQLQRERERADGLEAERERLVPDLLRERDRAQAERERAEHFEARLREALEARRGWLRRFFGF